MQLQIVWVLIGFVPGLNFVTDTPTTLPIIASGGKVYTVQATCEEAAAAKRIALDDPDVLVRCMPYWIDWHGSGITKRGK